MQKHFEKFLCQAGAWHTAGYWNGIPTFGRNVSQKIEIFFLEISRR
jgi:hypothetical protein